MSDKRLTKYQAAVIGAFTGISCGPFSDVHEIIERFLGRPVFTHELANQELWNRIKAAAKPEFEAICFDGNAPEIATPVAWIRHDWSGSGAKELSFDGPPTEKSTRDEVANPIWTPLYMADAKEQT